MKRNDTHAFVNQILVCVLVTICFGGSIGLGTVWMRYQISLTARSNRELNARIADVDRQLTEMASFVESEQSIERLKQRNAEMHLGLVPVTEQQLVHVAEDPVRRLAARANREFFDRAAPAGGVRFALGQ
jgi:hypothetical protein